MNHKTEFDNPPLPHTDANNEPTPYIHDRNHFEGLAATMEYRANCWRIMALLAVLLCFGLGGGLIYASSRPSATPFYVEVDKTGAVGNITKGSQDYDVKESSIEYFVGQTIQKIRSIPRDAVQYNKQGTSAGYFLTKNGAKKLGELMKDETPLEDLKAGKATDVEIIGISKVAGKKEIYQVRWKEMKFEGTEKKAEYTMTAFVSVVLAKPKQEDNLIENPFGIYIDDISWSKEK